MKRSVGLIYCFILSGLLILLFLGLFLWSTATWSICFLNYVFSLLLLQLIHNLIWVWNMKCPASSRWLTSGPASLGSKRLSQPTSGTCSPLLIKIIFYYHSFMQTFTVRFFHQFNCNFCKIKNFLKSFPTLFSRNLSQFCYTSLLQKCGNNPFSVTWKLM